MNIPFNMTAFKICSIFIGLLFLYFRGQFTIENFTFILNHYLLFHIKTQRRMRVCDLWLDGILAFHTKMVMYWERHSHTDQNVTRLQCSKVNSIVSIVLSLYLYSMCDDGRFRGSRCFLLLALVFFATLSIVNFDFTRSCFFLCVYVSTYSMVM